MSAAPAAARGADGAAPAPQSPDHPQDRVRVPAVFVLVADLALALGVLDLRGRTGCWNHRIDERWTVAVNAHDEPVRCEGDRVSFPIPPHSMYFEFNGWPAGMLDAGGGEIASGEAANEATLIEALKAAILRAKKVAR